VTRGSPATAAVLGLSLAFAVRAAVASDGVIEINQERALAGAINGSPLSDPAGYPVTITEPGSYRLSGNLQVPAPLGGIVLESEGVSLDLGGFELRGGWSCSCCPVSCSGGGGIGIRVAAGHARIHDGSIRGFGDGVVDEVGRTHVERVRVSEVVGFGISVERGSRVADASVRIASTGVAARWSIVERSTAEQCVRGITSQASLVRGSTALQNSGAGIQGDGLFVANTARANGWSGFYLESGIANASLARESTAVGNADCGILVGPRTLVWGGATSGNTIAGLRFVAPGTSSAIGSLAVSDAVAFSFGAGFPAFSGPVACGNCLQSLNANACE
jgi:hypothetical protein